jgi:hypothetical protein
MATAILELLQNRELAAKCARNGLQLAREQFCFDRMMHRKLQVDTEVVALHRDESTVREGAPLARDYIGN